MEISGKQKITPCLWFDTNAEEAVNFYLSVFTDSKITGITRYGDGAPMPAGSALTISFTIKGSEFVALNGGPQFKFTEAISLVVNCDTQEEINNYWEKLTAGGSEQMCGWLKDKYGLSWQIVPSVLNNLMHDKDQKRSQRVMTELLKMAKLDIKTLEEAYNG